MLPRKHAPNVPAAPLDTSPVSPKPLASYAKAPPHSVAGDPPNLPDPPNPPAPIVHAYMVPFGETYSSAGESPMGSPQAYKFVDVPQTGVSTSGHAYDWESAQAHLVAHD